MKNIKGIIGTGLLSLLPIFGYAQTKNPRGIYKMTTLIGKLGEMNAPPISIRFVLTAPHFS